MIKHLASIFLTVITCLSVYAQPGKDGNYIVPGASTVVNRYSQITSNVISGATTVTVNNVATDLGGLVAGDLIMLYQAQGATILTTDNNNYGTISSYNNAGLYEYAYVASVAVNTITIGCGTKNPYTAAVTLRWSRFLNITILQSVQECQLSPPNGMVPQVVSLLFT